jgi:hypothetical protein
MIVGIVLCAYVARGDGLWWLLATVLVVGHAMVYLVQVWGNEEKTGGAK